MSSWARGLDRQSRWVLLLLVAGSALAVAALWRAAVADPEIPFLTARGTAQWIVYPQPPYGGKRDDLLLDAQFRRSFALDGVPTEARLELRAFRRCELRVNDQPVEVPQPTNDNWKRPVAIDVAGSLRSGDNLIVATVYNDHGPPALWLSLDAGSERIESDASWEVSLAGSLFQPARPAWARLDLAALNLGIALPRTWSVLVGQLPRLALFAVLAVVLIVGGEVLLARLRRAAAESTGAEHRRWASGAVFAVLFLWTALFFNNIPMLLPHDGFDVKDHVEYIQYLLDHGRLPQANEGWEMYQPPLYYALSAGLLKLAGVSAEDPAADALLRWQSLAFALVHLTMIFLSLRLVFPNRLRPQLVGLALGAFLPAHLYVYQFVTNEGLAATCASVSVYLALRVMTSERPPLWVGVALGVALGAAMLSKFSALIVVVVALGIVAGQLIVTHRPAAAWLRKLAVPLAVCLLVCGWHFVRTWLRWGNPFIGNWDPAVWPGCR